MIFRKIFDQKLKARDILLYMNELSAHARPFPNHHNGKGKGHVLMVFAVGREEGVTMQSKAKPNFDKVAQWVQNLFKLKNFL